MNAPKSVTATFEVCTYVLTPTSASFGIGGGVGGVGVATGAGCAWTALSNDPTWVAVTSGSSGTSSDAVTYDVAANPGPPRTGTITIAGKTFIVDQGDRIFKDGFEGP